MSEQEKNLKGKTNEKSITNKDNEEDNEDIEEFEQETWNNQIGKKPIEQEWVVDWDNKPEIDEFYNELKEFLLKK